MQQGEIPTHYRVNCECDKWIPVALNQVGSDIYCKCGRRVVIPTQEEFAECPDQISSTTVEKRVSRLVASKKLPPQECCARCGLVGNTEITPIRLECERSKNRSGGGERFVYLPFLFFVSWQEEEWATSVGRDTEVNTPLCLCRSCRDHLRSPSRKTVFWLKMFVLVLGVGLTFLETLIGLGVILFGLIAVAMWRNLVIAKRRKELKGYLRKIAPYQDVLRGYPQAIAIISPESALGHVE